MAKNGAVLIGQALHRSPRRGGESKCSMSAAWTADRTRAASVGWSRRWSRCAPRKRSPQRSRDPGCKKFQPDAPRAVALERRLPGGPPQLGRSIAYEPFRPRLRL